MRSSALASVVVSGNDTRHATGTTFPFGIRGALVSARFGVRLGEYRLGNWNVGIFRKRSRSTWNKVEGIGLRVASECFERFFLDCSKISGGMELVIGNDGRKFK